MIRIIDGFTPFIDEVRASALASGFGTWRPNKGEVGSSVYEGMNYVGKHHYLLHALSYAMGAQIYPSSMFFRVTNEDTEAAYVHSDREMGDYTCIVYLSDHAEVSGTGFYRHRESGMTHMPSFDEMKQYPDQFERLKAQMVLGSHDDWEQLDFVRGIYNRALIFDSPRFHARCPKHGISTTAETGRLIWAAHFYLDIPLGSRG